MALIPPPAELHELVSGRKKGVRASLFRWLLAILEPIYFAGTTIRNWRYGVAPRLATNVGIPVISVGNLTVGGTGKSPVVLWLAQRLREKNFRVAIISRGYGADSSRNDEAMELEERLPDVPHVQHADRVAGAQIAIEELESEVLVLDDGFQHRRIARDLDIVLVDALCPFGYGRLLPRGLLRESLKSLARAHAVILTRRDLISHRERQSIREKVMRYHPSLIWSEASHSAAKLISDSGRTECLSALQGAKVVAFCGIGNPDAFRQTLEKLGAQVCAFRAFPDHHPYSASDIADLSAWATQQSASFVVCTHKDLVKLQIDELGEKSLWALQIEIAFAVGEKELLAAVDRATSTAGKR